MSLSETKTREALAEFCHNQWSNWMKYLFSKSIVDVGQFDKETGAIIIPREFVERWQRQMSTNYEDLSEPEKDSDRKEADKLIYHITQKINNKGESEMVNGIVDVSNIVDGEDMPVCPICDNEIEEDIDEVYLVKSNRSVALAHKFCVDEFASEESEFSGAGLA